MFFLPREMLIVNIDKGMPRKLWYVVTHKIVYPGYQITVDNKSFFP